LKEAPTVKDRSERLDDLDAAPRPLVSPSILDCDFSRVGEEIASLEKAGVRLLHLDVMDGHFVPNISYGPPVIADWRPRTDLAFDAHLMISEPGRYLDAFVKAGCDCITIHIEAVPEPTALIREIRRSGCRAALALNPPTPLESVLPYLAEVDKVLVMSVMPGFGGQSFDPSVLEKVRRLRAERPGMEIAIDGGIKPTNAGEVVAAGVTQLVVGSYVWRPDGNYAASLTELDRSARGGSV
jgi:ribulose-phosphate 3-epimerase